MHLKRREAGTSVCAGFRLAAGWSVCAALVVTVLTPAEAATVICALALAECLGAFLVVGWAGDDQGQGCPAEFWTHMLGALLIRWLALTAFLGAALALEVLPFLRGNPFAALYVTGASLLLGVTHLAGALRRGDGRVAWPFDLRLLLAAGIAWGLAEISHLTADTLLAALFLLWFPMALMMLRGAPPVFVSSSLTPPCRPRGEPFTSLGPMLLAKGDLLLVFLLLPSEVAFAYLVVRAAGAGVSLGLTPLLKASGKRLDVCGGHSFAGSAARVNLGLMLIGGGLCIGMLAGHGLIPAQLHMLQGAGKPTLIWILLGAASPAILGAGPLFMRSTGLEREWTVLSWAIATCMVALALGLSIETPIGLARLYAGAQLSAHAIAAAIIGQRCGVWPGLTALLFRRIRLF